MQRRPPPPPPKGKPAPPSPPPSDDDEPPPPSDDEAPPSDDDGAPPDSDAPPSDEEPEPDDDEMDEPDPEDGSEPDDEEEPGSDEPDEFDDPGDEELSGEDFGDDPDDPDEMGDPEGSDVEGSEPGSAPVSEEGSPEPSDDGGSEPGDGSDADFDEEGEPADDDEPEDDEVDIDEVSVGDAGSEPEDDEEPGSEPGSEPEPEDDEPEPENAKAGKDKAGTFVLPVRPAKKAGAAAEEIDSNPALSGLNLDSLSSGLAVKQPPKLLSKPAAPAGPAPAAPVKSRQSVASTAAPGTRIPDKAPTLPSTASAASVHSSHGVLEMENASVSTALTTVATAPAELVLRDPAVVRVEALANGYMEALGKFEGDEFEPLFLKINTDQALLHVLIAQGLPIEFDLSARAFVFEDSADPTSIILDYRGNIVVFKFASVDTLLGTMKKLPTAVFMVADLTEDEKKLVDGDKAPEKPKPKAPTKGKGKYDASHAHGTSVEDLLEEDFDMVNHSGKDQLDMMFNSKSTGAHLAGSSVVGAGEPGPAPRRRAELAESHIRKPQYSVRRVTLLCEWINSLHIWPNPITIPTLHREICNGLLLARIVKTVNPSAQFVNLNEKALAKKPALENLEQALGHIWRSKSLNNSRIPTSNDIYVGNTSKTAILLNELFGAYVQKPLYKNAVKILRWYHAILRQYNRPMPASTFEEGDLSTVWPHFQSGTALFCVIYHLFGPNLVGSGSAGRVRVDPLRVAGNPTSICDFRNNLFYVFTLLEALSVDVIWTPEDWISNPDTEFIMLQLSYIYEAFKHKQSALPPAQGSTAGMTSGPNGEPLVVGMIFLDSRPANARLTTSARKAVLLGHDSDSMPLLPVDRGGKSSRFISSVCPLGMVSNNAQLAQISVALRENRLYVERTSWNQSVSQRKEAKESVKNTEVVALLREHNKRNAADGSSTLTSLAAVPTAALVAGHGPGTLASGKLISEEYRPLDATRTVDGGKVYSAALRKINTDPQLQQSVALKGQEIEVAVQNLEDEMLSSQQQLNALEDGLANRYLDLESTAAHISSAEYEAIFEALEAERRELEDEKLKLQTHFSRKLESIKDIYSEAEQRVRVSQVQQQTTQRVTHKGVTTTVVTPVEGPASPAKGKTKGPAGITAVTKKAPAINKDLAEKGWVSQLKPTAHNYHLKNLQTASVAAVEACWKPKYVKAKEAQRKQAEPVPENTVLSPDPKATLSGPALLQPALTQEEQVEVAFNRFRRRLHVASARWLDAKNGGNRSSVFDIMNSSTAAPTVSLVSLPEKSFANSFERDLSAEQREELAELARTIRDEETARMRYEDERRRLVMATEKPTPSSRAVPTAASNAVPFSSNNSVASGNSSHRLNKRMGNEHVGFAGAAAVQSVSGVASAGVSHYSTDYFFDTPINLGVSPTKTGAGKNLHIASGKKPTQPEVDAAFKWLCIPRPLVIAERTPKEFVFSVVQAGETADPYSSGAESKSGGGLGKNAQGKCYVFEWREGAMRAGAVPEFLAGCVYLSDIKDITGPASDAMDTFTVVIGSSTKALKNSKGRTTVVIKCASPGECAKYLASLRCIRRSYDE